MLIIDKIKVKANSFIRRNRAKKTAYMYPSQSDGWVKYGSPVLGSRTEGIFFDPYVCKSNDSYIMYVSHRDKNEIVRFISKDGIRWGRKKTVLAGKCDSEWERAVNRACVVKVNNLFYMWYTGQNEGKSSIGLATSEDGVNFKRCSENPLIKAEKYYEGIAVMNPCVLWDEKNKIFRMWYSAGENYEPDVICYAESLDGKKWNRYSNNPVLKNSLNDYDRMKVGGCDVLRMPDRYLIFYIGYENIDNARICCAESLDGKNWLRNKNNPILSASKGQWDCDAVYKPSVISEDNTWRLWYNGRSGKKEYIGLAIKEDKNVV